MKHITGILAFLVAVTVHDTHGQEGQLSPVEGEDWTLPGSRTEFAWVPAMKCWVGKYEVTNAEYRRSKPDHDSGEYKGHSLNSDRQPVVQVSYDDAVAFAEWLTGTEQEAGRLPAGFKDRLPDGDEWTSLAQCGDGRRYPWGNGWPPEYGNYNDQPTYSMAGKAVGGHDDGFPVTRPVEESGKNDWGLYGVGGNVWEYTSELGPDGKSRGSRGVSFLFYSQGRLRCEFRHFSRRGTSVRANNVGFRLLLSH